MTAQTPANKTAPATVKSADVAETETTTTVVTETPAATEKEKLVSIGGRVSESERQFLDDYHWTHRMPLSDVLRLAVQQWIKSQGDNPKP